MVARTTLSVLGDFCLNLPGGPHTHDLLFGSDQVLNNPKAENWQTLCLSWPEHLLVSFGFTGTSNLRRGRAQQTGLPLGTNDSRWIPELCGRFSRQHGWYLIIAMIAPSRSSPVGRTPWFFQELWILKC